MKRTLFGLVVLVGMTVPGQQTGMLLKHLSSWSSDIEPLNNGTASVCGGTSPRLRLRGRQTRFRKDLVPFMGPPKGVQIPQLCPKVGRLSSESCKCNSFNLDRIFGNDSQPVDIAAV